MDVKTSKEYPNNIRVKKPTKCPGKLWSEIALHTSLRKDVRNWIWQLMKGRVEKSTANAKRNKSDAVKDYKRECSLRKYV